MKKLRLNEVKELAQLKGLENNTLRTAEARKPDSQAITLTKPELALQGHGGKTI
jgi:hypothetical protein